MAALEDSTYAGAAAYPYVSCALLELNSLSNGSLTINQNVKGTMVLRHGTIGGSLVQASCTFPATASTLKDRVVLLANLMIVDTLCKETYWNEWEAVQMGDSAWKDTPSDLVQWLIPQLLATGMAELEVMIWQGVGADPTLDSFDGFDTQTIAAYALGVLGDEPTNAGFGVPVDAAGIITALSLVIDAAADSTKSAPDFELILSFGAYEAYKAALGALDSMNPLWDANQALTFNGYTVKRANGMTPTAIYATTVSNMVFGTALLSDTTSVRLEEREMEEDIRFKAKFTAGVGVGCFSDITFLNLVAV